MQERWWEGLARFVCDWWWLILLIIALSLVAYFTSALWLPLLSF